MKSIYTLRNDIYSFIKTEKDWQRQVAPLFLPNLVGTKSETPGLRLSQMGDRCPRALWNSIHHPELDQPLPPWVQIKFAYGHMVEALAIALIKASGHEVTGEQDALEYLGVQGHRDCVVDGHVVDIKSASGRGMDKFRDGTLATNDTFGYLDQLDGYIAASAEDPLVRVKDRGFILAVNRDLGHMETYQHEYRPERIQQRVLNHIQIVGLARAPDCNCGTIPYGESGNVALDLRASYSSQKYSCFPNLRCFIYSDGPKYFTHVAKRPTNRNGPIIEVDKHGQIVYN